MHGEVRLFAVHGHHLGEVLQLKCTGKRGGNGYKSWKIVIDTQWSFAYPVMMPCSSLCSAPSAALSPEITEMPAVSQTHLSVYGFPLLGMREALTPERLRSRQARARLLSRDTNCQNSEQPDR